jgi:hypothetical protein
MTEQIKRGHEESLDALSSELAAVKRELEAHTSKPVPLVSVVEGRTDDSVLMAVGNPPSFQPFAFGAVVNRKSRADAGAVAERARLELRFETLDGQLLVGPIWGRWRDAPSLSQLPFTQLHTDEEAIDLQPNDARYEFDLGTKPDVWATGWSAIDAQQVAHHVPANKVRARVTVKGSNFADVSAAYLVSTGIAPGFQVELEA